MKGMKIKQNSVNFAKLKIGLSFKSLYIEKNTHYPISDLYLNVFLYIFEAKKGCKKKKFE